MEAIELGPFKPTDEHLEHLKLFEVQGSETTTIIDSHYNSTHFCLSEKEATRRAELISDIDYTFCLGL